jgi:hypothetical protein
VRLCRHLIVVILVYITLDLSLASMPGAFVFEASDSVESVQMNRTRDVAGAMTTLALARDPRAVVIVREIAARRQFVPMPLIPRMPLRTGDGPPTATPEPSPPSEDSH